MAVDIHLRQTSQGDSQGKIPQGPYRPHFRLGACPKCIGGTLYRTFSGETFTCFNCGFDDTPWARYYLNNPVESTITPEEIRKVEPKYAVPDKIEISKLQILRDLPVLGFRPTLTKYGISISVWYNVKRTWINDGTFIPDLRRKSGSSTLSRSKPPETRSLVGSIGQISSDGKSIPVAAILKILTKEENTVATSLENEEWPGEVKAFLQAKRETYRFIRKAVEDLARAQV